MSNVLVVCSKSLVRSQRTAEVDAIALGGGVPLVPCLRTADQSRPSLRPYVPLAQRLIPVHYTSVSDNNHLTVHPI